MDDVLLNPDVTAREWLRELLLFANVGQREYKMGNLPHIFCWPGSDWLRRLTMAIEKNSAHAKSMIKLQQVQQGSVRYRIYNK